MTTLIAVYNSEGCQGRCDEKCYGAIGGVCHCICGGKNHGVGRSKAIENCREIIRKNLTPELENEYNKATGDNSKIKLNYDRILQEALPI